MLDVGSDPGTITVDLGERGAPGRVTALEPSPTVLDLVRAEAGRRGCGNVDTVGGDVHCLAFP